MTRKKSTFKEKYGPWALVTGASSGIGEEFAHQLAAKGFNLVLAARRKQVLDQLARKLENKHNIQARTIQIDLGEPDPLKLIEAGTRDIEIGLLVNNAGGGFFGTAFLENDLQQEINVARLNAIAPTELAHHFGQKMSARGRGGIIFVASIVAYQGMPYVANYTAAKAYVLVLGESLYFELKEKGVDVTVLSPGSTASQGSFTEDEGWLAEKMSMGVEPVAKAALNALGKKPSVLPGLINHLYYFVGSRLLSRKRMAGLMAKYMKGIKKA